jgi:hypothetical protein
VTHGLRGYWRGCRCLICRAAEAEYRSARRRTSADELVQAESVRQHLVTLRGTGRRYIAKRAGISDRTVRDILNGTRQQIRAGTAKRLLAVNAEPAPGTLVPVWRTAKLLDSLEQEGWTREDIAVMLGMKPGALQCRGQKVRRKTADAVESLYKGLMGEAYDARAARVRRVVKVKHGRTDAA